MGRKSSFRRNGAPINSKIKWYAEMFSKVKALSPSLFADVALNSNDYDIKDERIRFIMAIHYLTFNKNQIKQNKSYKKLENELRDAFEKKKQLPN